MAKIIFNFEQRSNVKSNDVIVYNGKYYTTISKDAFLKDIIEENFELKQRIVLLENEVQEIQHQLKVDHGEEE